jgi:hypothetical protein
MTCVLMCIIYIHIYIHNYIAYDLSPPFPRHLLGLPTVIKALKSGFAHGASRHFTQNHIRSPEASVATLVMGISWEYRIYNYKSVIYIYTVV